MPTTIAVVNKKGGVGKTTTTFNLGGAYAKAGQRTLVVDLDPQASLTSSFKGTAWKKALPVEASVAVLFVDLPGGTVPIIVPTGFENLSLMPGSSLLDDPDELAKAIAGDRQFALRDLTSVLEGYDRVLIDCPPNLYFLTLAALTAADFVLTPTFADADGVEAIDYVNDEIARIQAGVNPRLVQLGIVLSDHYEKNANSIAHADILKSNFPALLFDAFIPHATAFRNARAKEKPMAFFSPKSKGAKAVARVAEEMEARITRAQGAPAQNRKEAA